MAKGITRGTSALGILLILLCAGCFRTAPDEETPAPQTIPLTDSSAAVLDPAATPSGDALPPITLIAPPTEVIAQPDTGVSADQPALTMVLIELPTSTPMPTLNSAPTLALPTITLQIITPGVSLGQLTPDATALPSRTPMPLIETTPLPGAEATDELGSESETVTSGVSDDGCIYTIEAGDSLYAIALSQDTTIAALLAANPDLDGENAILQIDQEINLPACIPGLNVESTEEADDEATPRATVPAGSQEYIVQSGDVLGSIASRFNTTVRAIMQANNLTNPDSLSIGQRLTIPAPAN